MITVALGIGNWVKKALNAAPLNVHSLFRPVDDHDPHPRSNTVSERKLSREGTPDEIKVILGWKIDTRKFRIFLPKAKALDWSNSIKSHLKKNYIIDFHL